MNKDLVEKLEKDVALYFEKSSQGDTSNTKIRNGIFNEMRPFLDRWLKNHLSYRKIYMSDEERLSLGWECFMFCLEKYDPDGGIPLPNHFFNYTKFFVMTMFAKEKKTRESISAAASSMSRTEDGDPAALYSMLNSLRKFRDTLPNKYKDIFDDALIGMAGRPKDKASFDKTKGYTYYQYCEAKNAFKLIINFLLLNE